jgi:hypothetical protein
VASFGNVPEVFVEALSLPGAWQPCSVKHQRATYSNLRTLSMAYVAGRCRDMVRLSASRSMGGGCGVRLSALFGAKPS